MPPFRLSLLAAGLLLATSAVAYACFVAPRAGQSVQIADESALIIWDSEHKVEHFIRSGTFQTSAQDFGFLVPTPSVPEFSEVAPAVFNELRHFTAQRVVYQPRPKAQGGGCGCSNSMEPTDRGLAPAPFTAPEPKVTVHAEQRIAGQDVAVLSAEDAGAIATWLEEHGYNSSPKLTEWMQPYVAEGWKITAFKFAREADADAPLQSQPICLSFATETPFYPYREPAELPEPASSREPGNEQPGAGPVRPSNGFPASRLLRVFFIGDARVEGTIGQTGPAWPGETVWSQPLQDFLRPAILKHLHLPGTPAEGAWHLTEFEDRSSPRPGTDDVYFNRGNDQRTRERPPIIQYVSRGDSDSLLLFALIGGAVLTVIRRRSRST